jgi:hypothetical protein
MIETLDQEPIINVAEAKRRGMISITMPMMRESSVLRAIVRDMKSVPDTEWALVPFNMGSLEVYRVPSPLVIRCAEKGAPTL